MGRCRTSTRSTRASTPWSPTVCGGRSASIRRRRCTTSAGGRLIAARIWTRSCGCSRSPGEIVWSRVFVEDGALHLDLGRGTVASLPQAETDRRWAATTSQWPVRRAVLHGVTRDQVMARHAANHVQVAYGADAASADRALAVKAATFQALGPEVRLCGDVSPG